MANSINGSIPIDLAQLKLGGSEPMPGKRTQDDVVIAVMGATGSGKSSFIQLLTGSEDAAIGDDLDSQTTDVKDFSFIDSRSKRPVTIVDTPGFDDSRPEITDTEILKRIANFLASEYDKERKLNGLIYVQTIASTRFSGSQISNLRLFRSLCGEDKFKNVVVLTTFWDTVPKELGEKREKQMQEKFFGPLVKGGARFMGHDRSIRSAQDVVEHVIDLKPIHVKIQEEIAQGTRLEDTEAGALHRQEIDALIARHREELAALKAEMDNAKGALKEELREELREEQEEVQRKLEKSELERHELKRGLQQHVEMAESDRKAREADKRTQDAEIARLRDQVTKRDRDWELDDNPDGSQVFGRFLMGLGSMIKNN